MPEHQPIHSQKSDQQSAHPAGATGARVSRGMDGQVARATLGRAPTDVSHLTQVDVQMLQRSIGNRAVAQLLQRNHTMPQGAMHQGAVRQGAAPLVQAKLKVGPVRDQYELEADRVAEQVVQRASMNPRPRISARPVVQRHPWHAEEEEVQAKLLDHAPRQPDVRSVVQRHPWHAEEEEVQAKRLDGDTVAKANKQPESGRDGFDVTAKFEQSLQRQQSGGRPLPEPVRADMEHHFGADFGAVRLHTDAASIQMNRDINARAFTHKNNIYFNAGFYNPGTQAGKRLLAHELTHVVQQGSAGVQRKTDTPAAQRQEQPARAAPPPVQVIHRMHGPARASRIARASMFERAARGTVNGAKWLGRKIRRWGLLGYNAGTKKRHQELSKKFGTQIGPSGKNDKAKSFSHGSLDRLDEVLSQIPRSHTAGNDMLSAIKDIPEQAGSPVQGASFYNPEDRQLSMVRPFNIPPFLYSWLGKKLTSRVMDMTALKPQFEARNVTKLEDRSLGIGNRSLLGHHTALTKGSLHKWTIRHEVGHSVDAKIKFTQKRARLRQFGGWKTYKEEGDFVDVANKFLTTAGVSKEDAGKRFFRDTLVGRDKLDEEGNPVLNRFGQKQRVFDRVEIYSNLIKEFAKIMADTQRTEREKESASAIFDRIARQVKDWNVNIGPQRTNARAWLMTIENPVRRACELLRTALAAPWTISGGGPAIFGRVYQKDQYGTWESYLKSARQNEVSNYQFAAPQEWFAEAYAAYYDPEKNGPRTKLNSDTVKWFEENLGPVQDRYDEKGSTKPGSLEENGKLQELDDIEDMEQNEDLAEFLEFLERKDGDDVVEKESQRPPQSVKLLNATQLRPGDILLQQGGNAPLSFLMGAATVMRSIFKGATVGALYHAGKDLANIDNAKFVHAAVYVGGGDFGFAHATGEGVKVSGLADQPYQVFRNNDSALAVEAARIATKWGRDGIGYGMKKATFGGGFGGSNFSKERASVLAAYAAQDITPSDMFCSEFAISVFQAAALLSAVRTLAQQQPVTNNTKEGVKSWAKDNKSRIRLDKTQKKKMLELDPRNTSPQLLASELYRLTKGREPLWTHQGVYRRS